MKICRILTPIALAALTLAGCTQSEILIEQTEIQNSAARRIEFGEAVADNATRDSKTSVAGQSAFEVGDVMGIYGYQSYPNDEYPVQEIFRNQAVTKTDSAWIYDPVQYFTPGSTYEFYGFFPQAVEHTFDRETKCFTFADFTVATAKSDQVDLMIAHKNETNPVNTVEMLFNHLLSNVNFYFRVSDKFNNPSVVSYDVVQFTVNGLKGRGTYTQTGYDESLAAVGSWVVDNTADYSYPAVTSGSIVKGEQLSLGDDLLLLPQPLGDDAVITITYRLNYADGTSSIHGPSTFALNKAIDGTTAAIAAWQSNFRYNYYISVNLTGENEIHFSADIGQWTDDYDAEKEI